LSFLLDFPRFFKYSQIMTNKDESVEFMEYHLDKSFKPIMADKIIQQMYWLDYSDHARAVAIMYDPLLPEDQDNNLICLFPPFQPSPS